MQIKSPKFRFRKRFRHEEGGDAMTASDVRDTNAAVNERSDISAIAKEIRRTMTFDAHSDASHKVSSGVSESQLAGAQSE